MRLASTYVAVFILVRQNETTSKMAARRHDCSICMDIFKNPKLIPCHHSFCYTCLEDYVKANLSNGRFNCPMCRKSVKFPPGGVASFQENFYIGSDSSETFSCDICGPKSVACSRCLECEENLCQTCCYVHEKSKATRHHKISDLGTMEPEMKGKIRQRIFCDQHLEEEIKLVCKDCKALICVLCNAIKHKSHATETVSDAAATMKKNIQIKMNQCSDKVRRITDSEREADALDKKINDAERKEIKALEDQRLQLIKVINKEVAKMKYKIHNVYKDLRQQNAALKRGMKEELKKCSTANDNARQIIDQGTDIDIMKKSSDLEQLLSTAMAETAQKPMKRMEKDLFSPVEVKVRKLIQFIGIMRDSTEMSPQERREQNQVDMFGKYGGQAVFLGAPAYNQDIINPIQVPMNQMNMFGSYRGDNLMMGFSGDNDSGQRYPFQYDPQIQMEEREKKEREEKQIQAFRRLVPDSGWRTDEHMKTWMCTKCQGWTNGWTHLENRGCGFNCKCDGNK